MLALVLAGTTALTATPTNASAGGHTYTQIDVPGATNGTVAISVSNGAVA